MTKAASARVALCSVAFQLATLTSPGRAQTIDTVVGGGFIAPSISSYPPQDISTGLVQAVAVDSSQSLYIADSTHGSVYRIAGSSISVVAGNGTPGNMPVLQTPTGLAVDGNGQLFIADRDAGYVYKLTIATGIVQTVAGCGSINSPICPIQPNYGDGGKATSAFVQPAAVAIDASGNLFIADYLECRVRKVDAITGMISTVAGSTGCQIDITQGPMNGDNGPATNAVLSRPQGIAVDSFGDIFIADTINLSVREVCGSGSGCGTTGYIKTVAGGGMGQITTSTNGVSATSVALKAPTGLAIDGQNVYVTDFLQNIVVVFNAGTSQSMVGNQPLAPGALLYVTGVVSDAYAPPAVVGDSTHFNGPAGLAFSPGTSSTQPDLYVADSLNYVVRVIGNPTFAATMYTVAGNFTADSFFGGNGPLSALLAYPSAVVEDASSNIYVSESSGKDFQPFDQGITTRVLEGIPAVPALKQLAVAGLLSFNMFLDNAANLFYADSQLNKLSQAYGVVPVAFPPLLESRPYSEESLDLIGDRANHLYFTGWGGHFTFQFRYIADYQNSSYLVLPGSFLLYNSYPYARDALGDGNLAHNAQFVDISGLCTDTLGNIYATDSQTNRVRVINLGLNPLTVANQTIASNSIDTIAGGTGALPPFPTSHFNYSAEQIGDGGPATSAVLSPQSCFVDNNGNIFVADGYNDRVRRIDFKTGNITTVAGTQFPGFSGDGGTAASATLNFPNGVSGDQAGNLLISDSGNHRIREIKGILPVPNSSLSCQNCALTNATGSNQTAVVVVGNVGPAPLVMTEAPTLTDATDFNISASTCPLGLPGLAANATCNVSVVSMGSTSASTQVILHDNAALSNATKNIPDPAHAGQWAGYLQYSDSIGVQILSAAGNFDPLSLVFTAVMVPQSIHVANASSVPLTISKIDVPKPFVLETSPPAGGCKQAPFSVAPNDSCNVYVDFEPQPPSPAAPNLFVSITDNTTTGATTIPVVGYALVAAASTPLSISNQSKTPATAKFNMIGIPPAALVTPLCSVTPAGLDVSCTYDIPSQTITATASIPSCTQAAQTDLILGHDQIALGSIGTVGMALLLPWLRIRRKRPLMLIMFVLLSYGVAGLSACSSTSHVSSSCVASVAPGTNFMLLVTASPQTAGQFPSLSLTTPDVISVTQ